MKLLNAFAKRLISRNTIKGLVMIVEVFNNPDRLSNHRDFNVHLWF